jgi:hypothetical protein
MAEGFLTITPQPAEAVLGKLEYTMSKKFFCLVLISILSGSILAFGVLGLQKLYELSKFRDADVAQVSIGGRILSCELRNSGIHLDKPGCKKPRQYSGEIPPELKYLPAIWKGITVIERRQNDIRTVIMVVI